MIAREHDDRGWPVVKVIDFGLVRSSLGGGGSCGFVGTPLYASPEQAEERELDVRADIYSLGCSLWFLLTGHAPFSGSVANIFMQHLQREPPWEDLIGAPPAVKALLRRMLAKKPAQRFRDAVELRRHIEHALMHLGHGWEWSGQVQRTAALAKHWATGQVSEHGGAWALAATAGFLMIFTAILGNDAEKPRHRAARQSYSAAGQAHAWVSGLGALPVVAEGPILQATETTGSQLGVRELATPSPAALSSGKPLEVIETVGTPPPKGPTELAESSPVVSSRIAPTAQDVAISTLKPDSAPPATELDPSVIPSAPPAGSDNTAPPEAAVQNSPSPANATTPTPKKRGAEKGSAAVAATDEPNGSNGFHTPAPEDTHKSHKPRHRSSSDDSLVPSITHLPHRITRLIGRFF